jgi:hypothetical protein
MEVIDLGVDSLEPISLKNFNSDRPPSPSVSFGPGIELLMNTEKRKPSASTSFNIDDLNSLENELNDLSKSVSSGGNGNGNSGNEPSFFSSTTKKMSNLFGFGEDSAPTPAPAPFSYDTADSKIGKATASSSTNESKKTFDGYGKINDIAVDFSKNKMTDVEKRRKKRTMIKKLEEWYEKGLTKTSSHFNMDSNYDEVEEEYESILEDKKCKDGIKLQQYWLITFTNSIEYANSMFDPFGLNLDGWGEKVSEDIDSYDDIFVELYNKYKGGKLSPEISLLLRLGFSAAVINITNKVLSTSTPGFNDVIKQSPELMKMFTNATVQSMGTQQSSFVNNVLNNTGPPKVNNSFGPPPPAIQTKNQQPPIKTMQYTRPDITASRGAMFQEKGININENAENLVNQDRTPVYPSTKRAEMRGPQGDINELLSGLKPKFNTSPPPPPPPPPPTYAPTPTQPEKPYVLDDDIESVISSSSFRELQSNGSQGQRRGRKRRSDRNIMALDI